MQLELCDIDHLCLLSWFACARRHWKRLNLSVKHSVSNVRINRTRAYIHWRPLSSSSHGTPRLDAGYRWSEVYKVKWGYSSQYLLTTEPFLTTPVVRTPRTSEVLTSCLFWKTHELICATHHLETHVLRKVFEYTRLDRVSKFLAGKLHAQTFGCYSPQSCEKNTVLVEVILSISPGGA